MSINSVDKNSSLSPSGLSVGGERTPKEVRVDEVARITIEASQEQTARGVVEAVRRGLTTGLFGGPDGGREANIDVICEGEDGSVQLKRYWFPNVSHSDLASRVFPRNLYFGGLSTGLLFYDEPAGCYASRIFGLSREESEDRYAEFITRFGLQEKHALQTNVSRNPMRYNQREVDLPTYEMEKARLNTRRQLAIQQGIETWKQKNIFQDVQCPSDQYLIEEMGYAPEWVACYHTILFIYKPVPSEKIPRYGNHAHSLRRGQKQTRVYYDREARPWSQKIWESMPSAPRLPFISWLVGLGATAAPKAPVRPVSPPTVEEIVSNNETDCSPAAAPSNEPFNGPAEAPAEEAGGGGFFFKTKFGLFLSCIGRSFESLMGFLRECFPSWFGVRD